MTNVICREFSSKIPCIFDALEFVSQIYEALAVCLEIL